MTVDDYQLEQTLKRYHERSERRQRNLYLISKGQLLAVDDTNRVKKFLERRGFAPEQASTLIQSGSATGVSASESFGVAEPDALERIMGSSDLMGVAFLELGLKVSRTVARIWVDVAAGSPRGYGTGFLISPRLLLTNHHVLTSDQVARRSRAQFNYQLAWDGRETAAQLFSLDPDAFFVTNKDLDYAVVAVSPRSDGGVALADFGFNGMIEEEGKAIAGQWVNIIQHPGGGYKQLALRENNLVDVFDAFLTYKTDTAPGSSGSPVFNDRWEVVGLHHSGVMAKDAQGRPLAVDGRVWTEDMGEDRVKWVSNEGIRISRIIADLRTRATGAGAKKLFDEAMTAAGSITSAERVVPAARVDAGAGARSDANRSTSPAPRDQIAVKDQSFKSGSVIVSKNNPTVNSDGSATWTIPLTVTVSIPGLQVSTPPAEQMPPRIDRQPDDPVAAAKQELGGRSDILSIRRGYVFENGWITKKPAVVIKVAKRKSPAELREAATAPLPTSIAGLPVEVINPTIDDLMVAQSGFSAVESFRAGLVDAEEIVYQPPKGAKLSRVAAKMKVTACVSPDHGWPVLESFLEDAKHRLVVGMYDFGAPHIEEAIASLATKKSFSMTMAIQAGSSEGSGTKADDLPDEEMIKELKKAFGSKFDYAWVKTGIKNGWVATSYHIKVAVRDESAVWLSSGNWQSSNQPPGDPLKEKPQKRSWLTKYNRDWHVVLENDDLAKTFEAYILNDFEQNKKLGEQEAMAMPDVLLPGAILLAAPEEAAAAFEYFDPFEGDRQFKVMPLLTPDNFKDALLDLVRGAEEELLIQNQTFNAATDKQADLAELLDAILERQKAGVDVRIIFRVLDAAKARENLEALQDRGFDMKRVKVQKNCHTKGVMVDKKRVMIGSQNISQLGITLNRDASLLFEDEELTQYFAKIFEHDWRNLARQDIGSEAHGPELVSAGEATPAGMIRLSWKDYIEMA